jgi:Flp pilus assembly protein TadG
MRSALARDEQGAAAVEFAIVSVAFFSFIFAIGYAGIMLFTDMALHWAVERSVRLAVIDSATTQTAIASEVNGFLTSLGIPAATVTYSVAAGTVPTAHINATLTQTYTVPLISTMNITYTADAYVAHL